MAETVEVIGGDYEFTLGLAGKFDGGELRYNPAGTQVSFGTILQKKPFQVCEFSLANYLMMRDRGADWMVATPVFLNRQFRHACILVRKDSPLKTFADLKGKKVGAKEYSQTAAVWFRGMLLDHYGVDWRDIHWTCGKVQRFPPPKEADVTTVDEEPEDMLLAGKLDALLAVQVKDNALPPNERKLRPLLPDVQTEERAYYTKTGIYPLNHTVERPLLGGEHGVLWRRSVAAWTYAQEPRAGRNACALRSRTRIDGNAVDQSRRSVRRGSERF
jgi:4,5-dihydroxyphthalate decarboxylase